MQNSLKIILNDEFEENYNFITNDKGILDLECYITEKIDKLVILLNQNFISVIDKYHIKKILIPNIKNISIYINAIKRDFDLEAKYPEFNFETIECKFHNYSIDKSICVVENLIQKFLNSLNHVNTLKIEITGKTKLNINLSNKILNIKNLKLEGLENIELIINHPFLETLRIKNINNINIKNLKKIHHLKINHININKKNKKNFEHILNNINIEKLSINNSKIKLILLLKYLKELNINNCKIEEVIVENFESDYFDINNTEVKNLKINQKEIKLNKTVCSLNNLLVKDSIIVDKINEIYIEDSNINNNLIIKNSKKVVLSNIFSNNIDIDNSYYFIYREEDMDRLKFNPLELKKRSLQINNTEKIKLNLYYDEIKKKFSNMPTIKLSKIKSYLMIRFLAEFETKNMGEEYILNYNKLLEIFKYFRNFKPNNVEITKVIIYNLPFGIINNNHNIKKLEEFTNILEQEKEKLENKIIKYFIQNVSDETWIEKNVKDFNKYKKIKTKTTNKIINI